MSLAPVAPRSTYLHSEDAVILRVHLGAVFGRSFGNEDGAVERYVIFAMKHVPWTKRFRRKVSNVFQPSIFQVHLEIRDGIKNL